MGELEPNDSRVVTRTAEGSGGRWSQETGIEPERTGIREGASRPADRQAAERQNNDFKETQTMADSSQIKEHMKVVGADGAPVGVVDGIEGDRIKLTKDSSSAGIEGQEHGGHHHFIPLGLVADIEGDTVRLSATGATAVQMEEEER